MAEMPYVKLVTRAGANSLGVRQSNGTRESSISADFGISLDAIAGMKEKDRLFSHNLFTSTPEVRE
jgi:hypothetical protein